jgi:hypothetical protein
MIEEFLYTWESGAGLRWAVALMFPLFVLIFTKTI